MLQKIEQIRYIRSLTSLMGYDPSDFSVTRNGKVAWNPTSPSTENLENVANSICARIAEDQKTLLELNRTSEAALLESLIQMIQQRARQGPLLDLCA